MDDIGTTTIASGQQALSKLLEDIKRDRLDWNEAETRFNIIDRIITECLGWPRRDIRLEQPQDRKYSDYELGSPRCCIWEAKRENRTFELPANPTEKLILDLPSIIALGGEAAHAVKQVQEYCSHRGVELAAATNGQQLIAFLASRNDGMAPLNGHCLVVSSYSQWNEHFPRLWQLLSPAGVAERRLSRFLRVGEEASLPRKASNLLGGYPKYRYPSYLHDSLRSISELLLIDLMEQPDVERQFYAQCYCDSGALSQHALISKQMLAARYAALFDLSEPAPRAVPVIDRAGRLTIRAENIADASAQRPIVILGDVGVGKTSFLKHLMYVRASEEFKNAICIYIDLGSRGALTKNLDHFILDDIERQLLETYGIDIREDSFVRAVYHSDITRFDRGIYGVRRKEDPAFYDRKLLELLDSKVGQRDQHLKSSILHIAMGRRKQVIVILDNVDQRRFEVQQDAFVVAQNIASEWQAIVFIAIRPQTFFRSKQSGTLTAYPNRVFTIAPPRIDLVIERRLRFALSMAEGHIPVHKLKDIQVRLDNIAMFIRALLISLEKNMEIVEFLSNITGENIRESIDIVVKIIGNANVDAEKIIDIMARTGRYIIPVHEFWKSALLGDFSFFDPQSSRALNLFDLVSPSPHEHFVLPMLLSFLMLEGQHRSKEGFVASSSIIDEMQGWGFSVPVIEGHLRRANNKKLIETPQRVTFEEDEVGLHGDMPENFRIGSVGAYHVRRWITEFSYLDAMSYDTPILDPNVRNRIEALVDSYEIQDRYQRAIEFRGYLTRCWHESLLKPTYFDWAECLPIGQESFDRVKAAIEREARSEA